MRKSSWSRSRKQKAAGSLKRTMEDTTASVHPVRSDVPVAARRTEARLLQIPLGTPVWLMKGWPASRKRSPWMPVRRGTVARRVHVGVVGEQHARPEIERLAEAVGQEVARRGGVLVCGGLGGVMEASSRGAAQAGGLVVGILPGTRAEDANPYVTVPVVTGLGEARNVIVVRSSDALVAVGGGYGTLSEIAYALKLGVPVVGLGTWELSRPGLEVDPIVRAQDPAEAVALAWELALRKRSANGTQSESEKGG